MYQACSYLLTSTTRIMNCSYKIVLFFFFINYYVLEYRYFFVICFLSQHFKSLKATIFRCFDGSALFITLLNIVRARQLVCYNN